MGRKPNPVIATHFVRGQKHGQTTNRYSQTCSHCNLLFPTGRPETLFSHLANCPGLTSDEQAEALRQIYSTPSTREPASSNVTIHQRRSSVHHEDFDITGLNVLAGAAENAEDLVIDPQITTTTEAPILGYYDSHYGGTYAHANPPTTAWTYPFSSTHDTSTAYPDLPSVSATSPTLSVANLSGTQWSFAQVITPPTTYVTHPTHEGPISFANQQANEIEDEDEITSNSKPVKVPGNKIRKSKAPYSEAKRARIAEMRLAGACIRCSRLRKTCEPARPCGACRGTAFVTWIGGCKSLHKGKEFDVWNGEHLRNAYTAYVNFSVGTRSAQHDNEVRLELMFLGANGPMLLFNLTKADTIIGTTDDNACKVSNSTECYIIHSGEHLTEKLFEHVIEHQDLLIDNIEIPALYSTISIAQGLSRDRAPEEKDQVWGTGKQADDRLARILNLWLMIFCLANGKPLQKMAIRGSNGDRIDDHLLERSYMAITLQIYAALETFICLAQDELRRFDADILHQGYKHLFNLVIGMFVILDCVETYCCLINGLDLSSINYDVMVEQAQTLADKYAYCVQNIQMMPRISFDGDDMLSVIGNNTRVNHEMQRVWLGDLSISRADIDDCVGGDGGERWQISTGRLWAGLLTRMSNK